MGLDSARVRIRVYLSLHTDNCRHDIDQTMNVTIDTGKSLAGRKDVVPHWCISAK